MKKKTMDTIFKIIGYVEVAGLILLSSEIGAFILEAHDPKNITTVSVTTKTKVEEEEK